MKRLKIEIDDYSYECSDGCCTNYGTRITVNGEELSCHNTDLSTQLREILTYLGYDVEVIQSYNGEVIGNYSSARSNKRSGLFGRY